MMSEVTADSIRDFGRLTTLARIKLWQQSGNDYITLSYMNLGPLVGHPCFPGPAFEAGPFRYSSRYLFLNTVFLFFEDPNVALGVSMYNFGLVPGDSVGISVQDIYNGASTQVPVGGKLLCILSRDSLVVPWRGVQSKTLTERV